MKPLIIYFSRTANNEKLAMQLQQRFNCPARMIIDSNKRRGTFSLLLNTILGLNISITTPDIPWQAHDSFILVAPIWAGRIAAPMQTFIRRYARHLKTLSFATVCAGQPGQREKVYRQLTRLTGKDPESVMELQLKHLLTTQNPPSPGTAGNYQIQPADWAFFDEQISRFVAEVDPKAAQNLSATARPVVK